MNEFNILRRSLSEANTLKMIPYKTNIPEKALRVLYLEQKKPTTEIARQFNCHHSTVLTYMKMYGIKRRSLPEAMTIYPKKDFSGYLLEKAYMIGFRIGDLHVHKVNKNGKTIVVECASTRPEQIDLIEEVFGKYGHVLKYAVRGFFGEQETRINVNLNESFDFLLPKNDEIASWILSNEEIFLSFLAGYIDAEGHIGLSNDLRARILVASYDRNILCSAQKALESIGVICPKPRISARKGYISGKKKVPYSKDMWQLGIYSKRSQLLLLKLLKPYLKHRQKTVVSDAVINAIYLRNQKFSSKHSRNCKDSRIC